MLKQGQKNKTTYFLILVTLVVGISHGIGISRLSFYGDDWIYVYNYHIAGPQSFTLFTQWDRPYSAWIYVLTSAVFGESAIAYHLFVLFLRWLSAILFWRILDKTFPNSKISQAASLLFATYPGFQQQPIAVEFVMHFTSLVLILLSIRIMQIAFFLPSKKSIALHLAGLVLGGLGIFTCEYFLGLELSRPLFLFYTVQKHESKEHAVTHRKKLLLHLIPYICVTLFYFIWRIFIFSFTTYGPKLITSLQADPINGIKLLVIKVVQDLLTVTVRSYRMIFARPSRVSIPVMAVILVIVSAAVFSVLQHSFKSSKLQKETEGNKRILALGLALLFLSGIPYWGTFLDVSTDFPWDRSTLSFSPGAAIIIAVFMDMAFKPSFFCAAAALLTAFSALFHVQNTREYIYESDKMNDYFWQLAWRVPELKEGAILASDEIPLDRTSDSDLSPVVNWIYAPDNRGFRYSYKYFDLDLREGIYYTDPSVPVPVDHTYRTHMFRSSTDKTLGIFYKKNGCLQIIDRNTVNYPDLPESLVHISNLSNTEMIGVSPEKPAQPPQAIGKEPDHGYCYYFQKTSLAQQTGDIESAYKFASEALNSGSHPVYASDLAQIVRAFIEADDFERAETMIRENQIGSSDWEYLCTYWKNTITPDGNEEELTNFYKSHGCS